MTKLGLGEHAKKSAHCPFHDDEHKSFSVFQGDDGFWHWKCHALCGEGDEIMFLSKRKGLSLTKAMNLFLDMAGFSASRPLRSHEYPKRRESPFSPVHPMSRGQRLEKELKALAARNACRLRVEFRCTTADRMAAHRK
jgi:DNA primase